MRILMSEVWFWSLSAICAVLLATAGWSKDLIGGLADSDLRAAAGVVAQIGATMLGFVLASLAILATVANTKLLRNMQRTGHYGLLLRRMIVCVGSFGLVALAGITILFVPKLCSLYGYLLLGTSFWSCILLFDVSRKFWSVLHFLSPE